MSASKMVLGALALAATGASAAQWELAETYDTTNFFSKFNFFSDADPTFGHVNYRTFDDATALGLIGVEGDDVFIRPDTKSSVANQKRSSVRIESKALYDHGLFIARFSKVPTPTCGVWPAFWTFGDPWVEVGEVDIIEQWHDTPYNVPAVHTGQSSKFGACLIDQSDMRGSVLTSNCDNYVHTPPTQFSNQGCTVSDAAGPWGSATESGVYAMEWTSDFLKLYSFTAANVPTNIDSETPDTASWGLPTVMLRNDLCDIDGHFARQKLVFNINFCGVPAKEDSFWKVDSGCAAKTGYDSCEEYVSSEPGAFVDAHYKIRDLRVFVEREPVAETSAVSTEEPEPTAEPTEEESVSTAEPTEDPEPTVEPTLDPETSAEPTEDPEPTAEPTSNSDEATSTEPAGPEPTDIEDPEEPTGVESGSPAVTDTAVPEYPEEPTAIESGSPETTSCTDTDAPGHTEGPESPEESHYPESPEQEAGDEEDCDEEDEVVEPCDGHDCVTDTESPEYPEHPEESSPEHPEEPEEATPEYPEESFPEHPEEPSPEHPEESSPEHPEYPEVSTPGYPDHPEESSPEHPAYPEHPEESFPEHPEESSPEHPEYPEEPSPEHPAHPEESSPEHPEHPEESFPEHPEESSPEHPGAFLPEHPEESFPEHPAHPEEPAPEHPGYPEDIFAPEHPEGTFPEHVDESSPELKEPAVPGFPEESPEYPEGTFPEHVDESSPELEEPAVPEEPEELSPPEPTGCDGPGCPGFPGTNDTGLDIGGPLPTDPVQVAAGVKGGVSLGLAALVAVFAL